MRLLRLLAALLVLLAGSAALAHALPGTAALLDFHRADVGLELDMPLDQFELGFHRPVTEVPGQAVARYGPALRAYLIAHVQPIAPDGRPWQTRSAGSATSCTSSLRPTRRRQTWSRT